MSKGAQSPDNAINNVLASVGIIQTYCGAAKMSGNAPSKMCAAQSSKAGVRNLRRASRTVQYFRTGRVVLGVGLDCSWNILRAARSRIDGDIWHRLPVAGGPPECPLTRVYFPSRARCSDGEFVTQLRPPTCACARFDIT